MTLTLTTQFSVHLHIKCSLTVWQKFHQHDKMWGLSLRGQQGVEPWLSEIEIDKITYIVLFTYVDTLEMEY